jgi:hypothetical protein
VSRGSGRRSRSKQISNRESVQHRTLGTGRTSAIPYKQGTSTFPLLANRSSGELVIRRIEHNGKVGDITDHRRIGVGFGLVSVYGVGAGMYLHLLTG